MTGRYWAQPAAEGIRFTWQQQTGFLRKRSEPLPFTTWPEHVSGSQALALAQLTAWLDDGRATSGEAHVDVPHAVVAELPAAQAAVLGLPPFVDLALHVETEGRIDQPDFMVRSGWRTLGGQPVRGVKRNGAWLETPRGERLLPTHLLTLVEAIESFRSNETADDDTRWRRWQALRAALPDQDDRNLDTDPYLRSLTIAHASRFGLEPRQGGGPLDFDPVLFGQPARQADDKPLIDVDDYSRQPLLPPADQRKFAEARFREGAQVQGRHTLGHGSYLVFDRSLQRALQVVRDKERGDSAGWRAFLRNPSGALAEAFGGEFDDAVIEALFVETEGYSARVTDLGLWDPPVLPWLKLEGQDWFGSQDKAAGSGIRRGLRVGDRYVDLSDADLDGVVQTIREAQAAGQPSVPIATPEGSVDVPATEATLQALDQLREHDRAGQSNNLEEAEPERQVLLIVTNFEQPEFKAASTRRDDHGVGEEPGRVVSRLMPHQEEGLAWLRERWLAGAPGALLADDMGLGKTLQALAFLDFVKRVNRRAHRGRPVLVVAPTSLLGNWAAEHDRHLADPGLGSRLALWGPDLRRSMTESSSGRHLDTGKLARYDWILTTYESLRDHHTSLASMPFAVVVFDEVQKIKNPGSLVSHAARTLKVDFTLTMTGTPVENRLSDLWSIADCANPGLLGDLKSFSARFEKEGADLGPLQATIREVTPPFMLRRLKLERLKGLPEKHVQVIDRAMPKTQQDAYASALETARSGRMGDALKALQGIRKISLSADPLDGSRPLPEMIDRSARLGAFRDCVHKVAERQEKTLIFVEYLALQPVLAAWLQEAFGLDHVPLIINGSVPGGQRQALVDRFQAGKPGFDAMILGPKSAGIGLTLTAANNVIHLTRWWNPAVEDQCTDRVFRIGQNRPVTVWLPQAVHPERREQSFDRLLHALLERKRQLSANALAPPTVSTSEAQELFRQVIEG
jgi:hypothetical protein